MIDSKPLLIATDFPALERQSLEILQVNLGYRCNLSCVHCHVNAGPNREEMMALDTIKEVLDCIDRYHIGILDLTGGAPEMNPHFKTLVREARQRGVEVIDRCNLSILLQPGFEDMAGFLADQRVVITASMPCYLRENVEKQRGKGVYDDSIAALQKLNQLGYGSDPALQLNLVYNPTGPTLPPAQSALEADYKRELRQQFGIVFNQLFTLANMPISRFGSVLISKGEFAAYMDLLKSSFNTANLDTVMCRTLLSVDWQGYLYDCDFNQMLDLPLYGQQRLHLRDLSTTTLVGRPIHIGDHCYGCTAGQGSSCGGALEGSG